MFYNLPPPTPPLEIDNFLLTNKIFENKRKFLLKRVFFRTKYDGRMKWIVQRNEKIILF